MLCKVLSPQAAGSGLPEFKSLLSSELTNNESEKLVSGHILVPKILGLICTVGCGLNVGTEGPFVFIAACISYFLMKVCILKVHM